MLPSVIWCTIRVLHNDFTIPTASGDVRCNIQRETGLCLLFTHTVKGKAHGVEEIKELNWNDLRLQLLHYYKVTNTKVRLQCDPNFKSVSLIQWLTFKKQQQMVYLINVQNQIKTLELADSSDNLKEIP